MRTGAHLKAGAAQVDITPPMGTQLAGDIGRRRPAETLVDPLFAKALVLDDGHRRLCVLSLDVLAIGRDWADAIRDGAGERFGIPREAVMVHAVQNHAAPSIGHHFFNYEWDCITPELAWLKGGDDAYHPLAVEGALEAIGRAVENMQPVRVGIARGLEGRVAESLRPVAVLLHHTCHPVHGYPERCVTAGWPGAWSRGVRELCGEQCVALVINGCCGNIHHSNHLHPSENLTAEQMGAVLTESTRPLLRRLDLQESFALGCASRTLCIPLREVGREDLQAARRLLERHPTPLWKEGLEGIAVEWDWVYALMRLDLDRLRREKPTFEYEVQAFRIGELAVLALMGEPFVEGQLRIKMLSPARQTLVAHMSHGYVGYVPTREALQRGGYETWTSNGSKLVPEALDLIVDASVELLRELLPA